MNNNWKTSVGELLEIFRGALLAIIPWIEKARISWKAGQAYDDWDNIADALYKNIVCASLAGEVATDYTIAKYNFHYENYSSLDFIQIRSREYAQQRLVFVSFQNISAPLDGVKAAVLNEADSVIDYRNLPLKDVEFAFLKTSDGKKEVIDQLDVVL